MLAKALQAWSLYSVEDAENIITHAVCNLPTSTSFTVEELYSAALRGKKNHADSVIWRLFMALVIVRIERSHLQTNSGELAKKTASEPPTASASYVLTRLGQSCLQPEISFC